MAEDQNKISCTVHQIYFSKWQHRFLEKEFVPLNNAHSLFPERREYPLFKQAYEENWHHQSDLLGMVSWRFHEKAIMTGKRFLKFIQDHPGFDVYFVDPFPEQYGYRNVWEQGEKYHPGIIDIAQSIFNAVGYEIDLKSIKNFHDTAAYCNFWVGNASFWDQYMQFTLPIYDYMVNQAPDDLHKKLFARADAKTDSVYFPFIMERLFSTLLAVNQEIAYLRYHYTYQELIKKYGWKRVNSPLGLIMLDPSRLMEVRKEFMTT